MSIFVSRLRVKEANSDTKERTKTNIEQSKQLINGQQTNTVLQGDCIEVMRQLSSCSVDFVLTDPPYLAHYCSRDGRKVANDDDSVWLKPAFAEIFRVMRRDSFCVSFYGWHQAYLIAVTIQWVAAVVHLWCLIPITTADNPHPANKPANT